MHRRWYALSASINLFASFRLVIPWLMTVGLTIQRCLASGIATQNRLRLYILPFLKQIPWYSKSQITTLDGFVLLAILRFSMVLKVGKTAFGPSQFEPRLPWAPTHYFWIVAVDVACRWGWSGSRWLAPRLQYIPQTIIISMSYPPPGILGGSRSFKLAENKY